MFITKIRHLLKSLKREVPVNQLESPASNPKSDFEKFMESLGADMKESLPDFEEEEDWDDEDDEDWDSDWDYEDDWDVEDDWDDDEDDYDDRAGYQGGNPTSRDSWSDREDWVDYMSQYADGEDGEWWDD